MFGREGPEGHAADDEGVDLPHRRQPCRVGQLRDLFRRQDAAEEGAQLELVPAGIEGRVGEHGDADELDLVQQAPRVVAPSAPPARLAAAVGVEVQLLQLVAVDGDDGVVGAHEGAHGAAHAGVGRLCPLPDAVPDGIDVPRGFLEPEGHRDRALAVDPQLDGAHRAYRRAVPAEGALLLIPMDLPGEVLYAECRRGKSSHWLHRPSSFRDCPT